MSELSDHSGPFDPNFSHDKFSKETLVKLCKAYGEYIFRFDALWYLTVMEKWGNDETFDCDLKVWESALPYELKSVSESHNIHGDDVATVMKYLQCNPWLWNYDYHIDLINNDHAILTFRICPLLLSLEKEGSGRERLICRELEPETKRRTAHFFNPNIKITGLKVPPRTDYNDCCCQWEYKLER